ADAGQVGAVGEACAVRGLGERGTVAGQLHRFAQPCPAQVGGKGQGEFGGQQVPEAAGRQAHGGGQVGEPHRSFQEVRQERGGGLQDRVPCRRRCGPAVQQRCRRGGRGQEGVSGGRPLLHPVVAAAVQGGGQVVGGG